MKNFFLILLTIFGTLFLNADPIETDSQIKDVMVYRTGARITRSATITVPIGQSEVVLPGLSTQCDAHSLQVTLNDGLDLISANYRVNYLKPIEIPADKTHLSKEVAALTMEIEWLDQQVAVYRSEEQIMTQKQIKLTSDDQGISIDDLKEYTAFYRERTLEIKRSIIDLSRERNEKQNRINDINNELHSLNAHTTKKTGQVILVLQSNRAQSTEIEFSYISSQAGWEPIYDLKAKDTDSPMDLNLKANIYQSTGISWERVKMAVSTGNPLQGNDRPILNPKYISFRPLNQGYGYGNRKSYSLEEQNAAPNALLEYKKERARDDMADSEAAYEPVPISTIEDTEITREYNISARQSIPSTGLRHLVALQEYQIETKYVHHSVPKLDRGVFLLAEVDNWGQYNLLPGMANIFFQNTYIGQSHINSNVTTNKILLSLGRDESIKVQRDRTENLEESSLLGFKTIKNIEYTITVKNTKSKSVTIELLDQIPISQHEDIEIELVKTSEADFKSKTGSLLWNVELAPGASREFVFAYTQKTPHDQAVVIR